MAWFLYLIGAAWVAIGSCMILYTQQTRATAKTILNQTHPIALAIIAVVSALLFFMAASASTHPWIIRLFGIIGLLKGVVVFLNPIGFNEKFKQWYFDAISDQAHRFVGIITVILGTATLSWIAN